MAELDYKIRLENFYGPLDLLLYLTKENELDITKISLVKICDQYIAYIRALEKLDINLAGEFLAIASQLLLVKSRALLPASEIKEEEAEDPSSELIKKLLEYRKFKNCARALQELFLQRSKQFTRPQYKIESQRKDIISKNCDLWDLVKAFVKVSNEVSLDIPISILYSDIPLEVFVKNILSALSVKKDVHFSEIVGTNPPKIKVIGTFLAILELTKEQKIKIEQEKNNDIKIELKY